jgi:undecaprenyl-diphosphatase
MKMRDSLLTGFIMGAVQGLTEFLPVSSSGHMVIVGELLDFVGEKETSFEIIIQVSSILAVVWLYRRRFLHLFFPQKGYKSITEHGRPSFSGVYGLWLLFLTSLPASVLGLLAHGFISEYLFNPLSVSIAMATGAVIMLLVEHFKPVPDLNHPLYGSLDSVTPAMALGVGFFQCLSLWPGFSRSASTIMGGMMFGASRVVAAEYAFMAAVPIMCAATGYQLFKSWHLLVVDDIALFASGLFFSFVFAVLAIKTFIALLRRITLLPFAVYRLALAPVIYYVWVG